MRKYFNLFILVLIFLSACRGHRDSADIISRNRMINLLTDVHVADGSLYQVMQNPDTLYKYGMAKYINLFKSYHTDTAGFRKSMEYYSRRPDELIVMYDQVLKNLRMKSDSLANEQEKVHVLPKK